MAGGGTLLHDRSLTGATALTDTGELATDALQEPPPELRYRHRAHIFRSALELWRGREIVLTLAERDLRVRYKEASLGVAWALLTPLALLVVFTFVFSRLKSFHTNPIPYPLFAYAGLVPWTFFSNSVSTGANSILANKALLNKVHFPRESFPLGALCVAASDTMLASIALGLLFLIERYPPHIQTLWVPLLILVEVAFAAGVALALSSALVYVRDLTIVLPILLQLGLFASPIAYPFARIPVRFQPVYAVFNPLGPIIDNIRRTMLLGQHPTWGLLAIAAASSLTFLVGGYALFKRTEVGFADTA